MLASLTRLSCLQQSSTVRRIKDDAAAASHTVDAVHGNLPSTSSAAADREQTASAMPSASTGPSDLHSTAANTITVTAAKPKAAAVSVKPKGPQVMVKAKRKAEDTPPDAAESKSAKIATNGHAGSSPGGGLMGLAAYGSDSSSGNTS